MHYYSGHAGDTCHGPPAKPHPPEETAMSQFRTLSDRVLASPQITPADEMKFPHIY